MCPSHTSEHGGMGDCVKEAGGEEGERESLERERIGDDDDKRHHHQCAK